MWVGDKICCAVNATTEFDEELARKSTVSRAGIILEATRSAVLNVEKGLVEVTRLRDVLLLMSDCVSEQSKK